MRAGGQGAAERPQAFSTTARMGGVRLTNSYGGRAPGRTSYAGAFSAHEATLSFYSATIIAGILSTIALRTISRLLRLYSPLVSRRHRSWQGMSGWPSRIPSRRFWRWCRWELPSASSSPNHRCMVVGTGFRDGHLRRFPGIPHPGHGRRRGATGLDRRNSFPCELSAQEPLAEP